jgi:hypothetical protein
MNNPPITQPINADSKDKKSVGIKGSGNLRIEILSYSTPRQPLSLRAEKDAHPLQLRYKLALERMIARRIPRDKAQITR